MPEFLIWAPTSFEELKQRANEKVKSLIYNDEFYEALYVDYESLPSGTSSIIRNTIVKRDDTIGNLTAIYELKMTSTDTFEVTVYLYEDSQMYGGVQRQTSYTHNGDFRLENNIFDMWRTTDSNVEDLAYEFGVTLPEDVDETGDFSKDYPELAEMVFTRFRDVFEYLANDALEKEERVLSWEKIRAGLLAHNDEVEEEINNIQAAMRRNTNLKMKAARWFDRRKYNELSQNNMLHTLQHRRRIPVPDPPGPFNENVMPLAFKYLNMVESIKKALVMCLLQFSSQAGGKAFELDVASWDDGTFLRDADA